MRRKNNLGGDIVSPLLEVELIYEVVEVLERFASELDKSIPQVAITGYCIRKPFQML
ncbi:hypothetical protein [Marivirga sp.]|uniref:hypothetical protein n=1 Tax=Marivirga sp. TaxID=2018662 RepID=UPI002D7E5C1F|nr:hypothetical protein [Marivirga sp.]HET8860316.1 hypothetical protein [Marivirga sp.]